MNNLRILRCTVNDSNFKGEEVIINEIKEFRGGDFKHPLEYGKLINCKKEKECPLYKCEQIKSLEK